MMKVDKNRNITVLKSSNADDRSLQFFQSVTKPAMSSIIGGNTAVKEDDFQRDSRYIVQEVQANLEVLEDLQARMGFMLSEINKVVKRS